MRLKSVEVQNFRALEKIVVEADELVTLIVGRNNSGKTSLLDVFAKFFGGVSFVFEDFSMSCIGRIENSFKLAAEAGAKRTIGDIVEAEKLIDEALTELPHISLLLSIAYSKEDDLSSLDGIILDLDETRQEAQIRASLVVEKPIDHFTAWAGTKAAKSIDIADYLRKEFKNIFKPRYEAVDPGDPENKTSLDRAKIDRVFSVNFVYAQNKLDDASTDQTGNLSKTFDTFYRNNGKATSSATEIDKVLLEVSSELDGQYETLFKPIFTDLVQFGLETRTSVQKLKIKSFLEAQDVIGSESTKLYYESGDGGHLLPEGHNGLGYTKLIYTILQFVGFYEKYRKAVPQPAFQVLFIEEPEAHLHPQMQEVFIRNINDFIKSKTGWHVQVVITTHSSHVVASSGFERIRYFGNSTGTIVVKDMSTFKNSLGADAQGTLKFLNQYMVLHRCDMFFADKVILIEGTVERLLLPEMIKRCAPDLQSSYISIVEVGGAHAIKFRDLLEFIDIPALVVTDIDSIDPEDKRRKCDTSTEMAITSNTTLIDWIPKKKSISTLKTVTAEDKVSGRTRVAYQVAEVEFGAFGRSFEEAFIIKNSELLSSSADSLANVDIFRSPNGDVYCGNEIAKLSYDLAKKIEKKTDFAFDMMLIARWETPRYIQEGLQWLSKTHS